MILSKIVKRAAAIKAAKLHDDRFSFGGNYSRNLYTDSGYGAGYAHGGGVNSAAVSTPQFNLTGSISDASVNNGLLGAGIGAAAGIGRELLKGRASRKNYLKSMLIGLLAGGSIGLASTAFGNLPDYTKRIPKVEVK